MKVKWKAAAKKIRKLKKEINSIPRDQALYFVPGVFLVILGLMTCAAPDLFIALVASFFIFCGVSLSVLAWRFIQFRRKVIGVLKQINNSRIVVRTVDMQAASEFDPYLEGKKIVFH